MEAMHTEAEQAYGSIHERIISLEMPPGSPINSQHLAEDLGLDLAPVQEALRLLAHDSLVTITPRHEHGIYVTHVHLADLDELSEARLTMETACARLAAQRATAENLELLASLRQEYAAVSGQEARYLFDLDHRFHQAIAQAAHNRYLSDTLDRFFGLSLRLWNLVLAHMDFLPAAVEEHLALVEAIEDGDSNRAAEVMYHHVQDFYDKVRKLLTVEVTVHYGSDERSVVVEKNALLGAAIIATGLPLEQPCAGRGTCGKCKVLVEGALDELDDVERKQLSEAEIVAGYRLACRARATGRATVTLAPIVVYSNKIFQASDAYKRDEVPLGLAIDLGSTTVAAFLTTLPDGQVCAGAAALNQQTVFGADIISRMAEASEGEDRARLLSALAQASIIQAVDALRLSSRIRKRIQRVTIVGNCAMHHLLLGYPVDSMITLPFQPHSLASLRPANDRLGAIFPPQAEVAIPPLIGGFVGSDALACLAWYGFDRAPGPMAAIDLGTNGEVMVTDGAVGKGRILVASTAAGPAFEGVNISCGTRAVDGAIVGVKADAERGSLELITIGDHPPVGLTGSGLLDLVYELRRAGVINEGGRIVAEHPTFGPRIDHDEDGVRRFLLTHEGVDRRGFDPEEEGATVSLYLTQHDVRELQKAKAAVRAAAEVLMARLGLQAEDLQRLVLTGSFGSQVNVEAVARLGMIPAVDPSIVEPEPNGAGMGAALFLDNEEFIRGERIAEQSEQIDLDLDADFNQLFIEALALPEK
jgi:uncharacterized 2Fe-2S/4Fe-4S cluster protein (DUF4445 family)/DNA-binding GntR family transcriptional regulator